MISSCRAGATIVRVKGVEGGRKISTAEHVDLPAYAKNRGRVQRLATIIYFVADTASEDQSAALYRQIDGDEPEALVYGVDNMRIVYEVDGGYRRAGEVEATDWADVENVQVALLVNSVRPVGKATPD